ncbi:MAG: Asp-tRNA(Asn)/Glu-tRNA(Gln) amidotransferase subunit GatA [Candidatus Saccharicenans sp.]
MNLLQLNLTEAVELVKKGEILAEEIVLAYIRHIETVDPRLKAYLTYNFDRALEKAKEIDRKPVKGKLAGAVVAVKDNIVTKGIRTTCASRVLENFIPPYNATVVERLEAEDAIIIGKTNLDEFAMGSSTENSAFFPTRNPWDLERVPGGSSGGSAAAVAAFEAMAALGSDTGGSVRQPAAFCGVVGLKPTYGRVSRYGLVAFASSLDQVGPLARSVEDCALLTAVISGYDRRDSTTVTNPVPDYVAELGKKPEAKKVGVLAESELKGINEEVAGNYFSVLKKLREEGWEIEEMNFPSWKYALPCYYIIAPSEASSNLARYDGVRFGLRVEAEGLAEMYHKTRTLGFGPEVKRRILLGTFALSSGYYEAYYAKAARARQVIGEEFSAAFKKVDFILTPTTPEPAFKLGAKQDPISMYLQDYFTVAASLAGVPAVSLPSGLSAEGLPLGMQVIGPPFLEDKLLNFVFLLEKKLEFKNNIERIIEYQRKEEK